jgi:hypothetical protein
MIGDQVPQTGGDVVAHAVDEDEFRAGNGGGGGTTTAGIDHGVGQAVHDQRRDVERPQAAVRSPDAIDATAVRATPASSYPRS